MRPQNLLSYEGGSLFDCAAVYAEGIAFNHPFVDGNKRTAFATAGIFLETNGYRLEANQEHQADLMVNLAEKKIKKEDVAAFLKEYIVKRIKV